MKKLLFNLKTVAIITTLMLGLHVFGQDFQYIGTTNKPITINAPKTGAILFDQISDPGDSWMVSQHYSTVTNNSNTCAVADDFVVPIGESWDVHSIGILGAYWQGAAGGGDTVNLYILNDDNGIPGDTVQGYFALTGFQNEEMPGAENIFTYFEIELPSLLTFTEGTYWVSVQLYSDYNATGQWGWLEHNIEGSIYGAEWYWINPKDGWGLGATTWTPANVVVGPWVQWEMSFALYGVPENNDVSVLGITSPDDYYYGPPVDEKEVTVKIKNEGTNPQSGFDISYNFNGTEVTENIGAVVLGYNETLEYTFTQTVDLSSPGLYTLDVSTMLTGDENPDNNTQSMEITVFDPTVYTMPSYSTGQITASSGTFTDAGGIDGDLIVDDWGVLTIFPVNAGDKVRLDFIQFEIGWSDFWIYDGENTLATELGWWEDDISPGTITAGYNNTSGALTIHFVAQTWTPFDGFPGWAANISNHTPVPDDFEVMKLETSNPQVFENDYITAYAFVKNQGTTAQSKNVTFTANGDVYATVASVVIQPSDTVVVEATWNPELEGDYELIATVPDDGNNNDNSASMTQHVFPFDYFYEGFELPLFPPDGWSQSGSAWTHHTYVPAYGNGHAYCWVEYGLFDTLFTPKLHIEAGDKISFNSFSSPWWPGQLDLCWIDAETGVASLIQSVSIPYINYQYFEINVSAAAGDNYLGFVGKYNPGGGQGELKLDEVKGIGIERFYYENDLKAYTLSGDITPEENIQTSVEVEIKNIGSGYIFASDYSVKLMQEPGIELMSYEGVDINPKEILTFTLDYIFPYAGLFSCYVEVDFGNDQDVTNNTSSSLNVYVQQEGTEQVYIGENNDFESNWTHPIVISSTGLYAQTLYLADDVGEANTITGIMYYYSLGNNYPVYDNPITIWMSETEETNMSDSLEAANNYTLVFEGTFDAFPGFHGVYIPLDFVYSYQGGNLLVTTYKDYEDGTYAEFYVGTSHPADTMVRYYNGYENNKPIDPYDQQSLDSAYLHQKMEYANTKFFKFNLEGQYCTPQVLNGTLAGDYIDGVTFNGIENLGTGSIGGPPYNNFTNFSANVERGRTYELTIQAETSGSNGSIAAWIDFNGNQVLDDEGERVVHISSNETSQEISVLVTIPDDAALGLTILRVRNSSEGELFASCQAVDYGETEDYGINIIQTIQAYNPVPEFTSTLLEDGNVDLNWMVPENNGIAYIEGFELSTWPPQGGWEVKQSTTLDGALIDPTGETWVQYNENIDSVYNGAFSALVPASAMDFNWLITPDVQLYGNDELSFMLNYNSDVNGYSKFYVLVEADNEWYTVLEYTEEITMNNNFDEKVVVDLSEFAGKIVRVAFVSEYNDAYSITIDDAILMGAEESGKSVSLISGYEIYRNGEMFETIGDVSVIESSDVLSETENYQYCIYVSYADGEESEMVCDEVFYLSPLTPPMNVNASANNNDVYVIWTAPDGGIMRFADGFEDYTAGQQVACQNPDDWTTWTIDPCGVNDPFVTTDMPYTGDNSVVIENEGDLLYLTDELITQGKYSFNFRMYLPSGFNGYFNVLQDHDLTIGALWGMQAFFDLNGIGTLDAGGYGSATFLYGYDEWMYVEVVIDLDNDMGEFLIDGVSIHEWQWSTGISGAGGWNTFEGGDFYAWNTNNTCKYYIDDFQIVQLYDSENLVTYNVYKDGGLLGNTSETDFDDTSVDPGYHEYCISAVYDEGESEQACDHVTLFSAPENFAAMVQNENEVICTWDEVSSTSLEGYYVYRDDAMVSGLLTGLEWTDEGVEGGTHSYYVTTAFTEGESLPSNIETVVVMISPKNLVANANINGDIVLNWDAAGIVVEGNLVELYQHDNTPVNGLYQWFDIGYGVVFDLGAYPGATIEMADFHHSSYGTLGTWSYMFHIVDWNTLTEVGTAGPFQTTGNDKWELDIPLGSVASTSLIGVFLEPMSNDPQDAFPVLSIDEALSGFSLSASLFDYSQNSPAPGDFLLDLWIWTTTGKEMVKAKKVKVDNMHITNNRAPFTPVKGDITVNQKEKEGKALIGYNVYYGHNDDPFDFLANVTDTTYTHVGAGYIQGLHKYQVTSSYEEGESGPSNIATEYINGLKVNNVENINIYPNPVTDATQINAGFTILAIEVVNPQGQVILSEENLKSTEYKLDLKNQPAGIYNVRIESGEGWINRKLIKK